MSNEPAVSAERKSCAFGALLLVFYPHAALAADSAAALPALFGIPVEFILFGATLIGIAIFHRQTLRVALAGLAVIVIYKFAVVGFQRGPGFGGFIAHLQDEWVILPQASWQTALGLGYVSAVFDNIPLTALALRQGGYDWGFLAYAVGFGGSMMWFGSSAGVALSNMFPESKSVVPWVQQGWYVIVTYPIAFAVLLRTLGWQPHPPHKGAQFNTSIPVALFTR